MTHSQAMTNQIFSVFSAKIDLLAGRATLTQTIFTSQNRHTSFIPKD